MRVVEWIIMCGLIAAATLMVLGFFNGHAEYSSFMAKCLNEGHKEVECRIKLHNERNL